MVFGTNKRYCIIVESIIQYPLKTKRGNIMKFNKSLLKKWWFWVVSVFLLFAIFGVEKPPDSNEKNISANTTEKKNIEKKSELKQIPEKIENIVLKEMNKVRIKDIKVNEIDKIILIHLHSEVDTKYSYFLDCKKIIQALSKREDINDIEIIEYSKLVDVYGKEIESKVFNLRINKDKYNKIEWKNFNIYDFEKIADYVFIHNAIEK